MNARSAPVLAALGDLSLRSPGLLLLALLVPVALLLRRRRGAPAVRFAPGALLGGARSDPRDPTPRSSSPTPPLPPLPRTWRTRLVALPRLLQGLGILLAILAVARPVERVLEPVATQGIDVLLVLDVSSSMTADDMDARRTRLEVARDAAIAFANGRPNDRIGLLTFARYPDVRCPLTLDHRALARILGEVRTVEGDGPEDATGLGTAVARAAQVLEGSAGRSRVVILLTDGEENVARKEAPGEIAPVHAAQLCAALGVRVYAVAAGSGRRTAAGGFERVDVAEVARLATRTGGTFSEAKDAGAMARVYAEIGALETARVEEPRSTLVDRFLPLLVGALALLLVARLLESTVLAVWP